MVFITAQEILETVSMIRSENLDVRAVTMGISLADCAAGETRRTAERIHAKIVRRAGRLVEVAAELQEKYGIPIVNRRVSVTPIADVVGSDDPAAYVEVGARARRGRRRRSASTSSAASARSSRRASRAATPPSSRPSPTPSAARERVCSSVNVASTRAGINMDAVLRMADVLLAVSKRTADARLHRLRQDRRLLQRARGQPLHGRRDARQRRAGVQHQRGHLRPRRRAQRRRRPPGRLAHRARRPHQAHDLQDHARRRARRPRGLADARRRDRHHRPLAGAHAGGGRLHRRDPREHGAGAGRRSRHDRRAGHAQRRRQEGRHDGHVVHRRPVRRLHPGERGRGDGQGRRRRRPAASRSSRP